MFYEKVLKYDILKFIWDHFGKTPYTIETISLKLDQPIDNIILV